MSDIKRIHLMHRKDDSRIWYIFDTETDDVLVSDNGKIRVPHTDDVMQADSLFDLLLQIWDKKSGKFLTSLDWLGSDGQTRWGEYPIHYCLHRVDGFIKSVYKFDIDDKPYLRAWEINYPGELWVVDDDYTIKKVKNFSEKMKTELDKFVEENKNYLADIEKRRSEEEKK